MNEGYDATRAQIHRIAEEAFQHHRILDRGQNEWLCINSKSGNRSFRLIIRPGTVILFGDLGDGILHFHNDDALGWLRGATRDAECPEYLLGKLDHPQRRRCFYAGDALAFAREMARDDAAGDWDDLLHEAQDHHRHGELDQHLWVELLHEHVPDSDAYEVGMHYDEECLWIFEALRWFVAHLPAETPKAEVSNVP